MSSDALKSMISVALGNPNKDLVDRYPELTAIEKIACRYFCCSAMMMNGMYDIIKKDSEINEPFPNQPDLNPEDVVEARETDEKFLRNIENKIGISEEDSQNFRRMIFAFVGTRFLKEKEISWDMQPALAEGFRKYHKEQLEKN